MNEPGVPSASTTVKTYHCLCSNLVVVSTHDLASLPRRSEPIQDSALIITLQDDTIRRGELEQDDAVPSSALVDVQPDRRPIIIRRDDGFEKRTLLRCGRCKLVLGYNLDEAHFEKTQSTPRPTYLLPGGLVETADMVQGARPETPAWAEPTG